MLHSRSFLVAAIALALPAVTLGQQALYGQCGGIGWTGPTSCVSGSCCVFSNSYYSQCLTGSCAVTSSSKPTTSAVGVTTSTARVTTSSLTTSKASTTSSSTQPSGITPPNSAATPGRLWEQSPANHWNDTYFIGNGRLGGAIEAGVQTDTVWLNEDSFWDGNYQSRVNRNAKSNMPKLQNLIATEQISQAATLASQDYVGTPTSCRNYDQIGAMTIVMGHGTGSSAYERYLDINSGTSGVYYVVNGVSYFREYIASKPAGVMAIRIAASQAGAVSFTVTMARNNVQATASGSDSIFLNVAGGGSSMGFASGVRVVSSGGSVTASGNSVRVSNANEAYIYFQAWTTFRQSNSLSKTQSDLAAISQSYASIRATHIADYQALFTTAQLNVGSSSQSQRSKPTSQRLVAFRSTNDPDIISLYYHYSRYLLISSSRTGSLPANLQGNWNQQSEPEWGSRFTININLQMNYWSTFVGNLIEDVSDPFFAQITATHKTGLTTAQTMYGLGGSVAHHNTDLWGDSAPQDNWPSSTFWSQGLAWLVTHTYDYYLFTQDTNWLEQNITPLRDAVLFYTEFLTPYKGWMVTNPSLSPENTFQNPQGGTASITCGPTIDNSILWTLFGALSELEAALGTSDASLISQAASLRAKLPPLRKNQYGGIMEWINDYGETQPGMPHLSQLWGAYPGSQITSANSTTFAWAISSLTRRLNNGSGGWGWTRAWATCLGARFFNSALVQQGVVLLASTYATPDTMLSANAPSVFQIDGNLGGPAGMLEALLQSHEFVAAGSSSSSMHMAQIGDTGKSTLIRLLPALPSQWTGNGAGGSVTGLRARGGWQVDIFWDGSGKLTKATLTSLTGSPVWVTLGTTPIGTSGGTSINVAGSSGTFVHITSPTKGTAYTVTLS